MLIKNLGFSSSAALALALLATVAGPALGAGPAYNIVDLGTFGGTISQGKAINAAGDVTGVAYLSGNSAYHAFLYRKGVMTDLGTVPGGGSSAPYAINASGMVVGTAAYPPVPPSHAFVYGAKEEPLERQDKERKDKDVMTDLGEAEGLGINAAGQVVGLGGDNFGFLYRHGVTTHFGALGGNGSIAGYINDAGQIAGQACTTNIPALTCYFFGPFHAFLVTDGNMIDLGTLGGSMSRSRGMNARGQVTGFSTLLGDATAHAFIYSGGVMTDLGTLGGSNSTVQQFSQTINIAGQVAGWAQTAGNAAFHAFLYSGGSMGDLGTLGGTNSYAFAVNNNGQVAGYSQTAGNAANHAFFYGGGVMADLQDLIPAGSGWTATIATAMNDRRQITGYGTVNGETHAFLATPVNIATVQPPVNPDISSVFNDHRGVIPVKFDLTVNNVKSCQLSPATITVTRLSGGAFGPVESGDFKVTGCEYHYNLAGASLGEGRYRVDITVHGEIVGSAQFTME